MDFLPACLFSSGSLLLFLRVSFCYEANYFFQSLMASTSKMNHFHVVVCEQRRYNDWLITEKHATSLVENVRHVMGFNDPGINVTRGPRQAQPVSGSPLFQRHLRNLPHSNKLITVLFISILKYSCHHNDKLRHIQYDKCVNDNIRNIHPSIALKSLICDHIKPM